MVAVDKTNIRACSQGCLRRDGCGDMWMCSVAVTWLETKSQLVLRGRNRRVERKIPRMV